MRIQAPQVGTVGVRWASRLLGKLGEVAIIAWGLLLVSCAVSTTSCVPPGGSASQGEAGGGVGTQEIPLRPG